MATSQTNQPRRTLLLTGASRGIGHATVKRFSGNGWREQVITRQPAAEKRFTVACPMPRLAPVSSRVRRGWLVLEFELGIRAF